VAEPGSFDVRTLAATTANTPSQHDIWCRELERWLIDQHIAEATREPHRYELTEHGAALAACIAKLNE
jgi:hypothetical protein